MATLYQGLPSLIKDLKVTLQDSTLIFSPQENERKSMFLSNIDQVLNFDVQTIHFFTANPNFPPDVAFKIIENSIKKLLVPYNFLAGRMKLNPETHRFEFDCNNAGIGFVVASSELLLDELGDLVYPNPSFEQLVTKRMNDKVFQVDDHPLCIFQMTSFKCGGFAMGVQTNHAAFDGISFKYFLQNLAALAGGKPLAMVPCNERELLVARSPPRVEFPHLELFKLKTPISQGSEIEQNPNSIFDNTPQELDFKIFKLSHNDILDLKARVGASPTDGTGKKIPSFNVVSTYLWRCKTLSSYDHEEDNSERPSTLLYAVDIRPRLSPPLPSSYTGNAVLTAYAMAKCKELEEAPLSKLVDLVSKGSARMTDEYLRSAIDWGELYKGFPKGELLISSWWRLGFNQVEYPWDKPKYSCPLVNHKKDIMLLFPDVDESNGGVNILVALPQKEMTKFQALFHKFLSS